MDSHILTVVTHGSLRNQLDQQEWNLAKASRSHLTTTSSLTLACLFAVVFTTRTCHAQAQNLVHPYLSQSAIAMHQILQAPCEQELEIVPLETLLDSIASAYQVPIWCDRRVARDLPITIDRREETLEQFLKRAVAFADADLIPLAGVLMVCPKSHRDAIEASHWRLAVSHSRSPLRPLGNKSFGWPDGSVASTVIDEFAARCSLDPKWNYKIDRDIWRAFEFPKATSAASISVCLLSGFDLCLTEQGGNWVVGPLPESELQAEWVYALEDIKRIGPTAWNGWRERWPDSKFAKTTKPDGWRVTATVASHRDLIAPLIPKKKWDKPKPSEVSLDRRVYSATFVDKELELVIRSLAASTKLDFYPLPLPASLESKKVNMKLDRTPIDEILKEISRQCGVRFKRDGQRVEIIP